MFEEVIQFWFEDIDRSQWWVKDEAFDDEIRNRFSELHRQAASGELFFWRDCAQGRLAEIIILDQFSRNMFRDTSGAFSQDTLALVLAQEAVRSGADAHLSPAMNNFLYMPYMHSESRLIHEEAVKLFTKTGDEFTLDFELKHKKIIDDFGRYPHRNAILSRVSTEVEVAFLNGPDSSF